MRGRARARPDDEPLGHVGEVITASMRGRARARPDRLFRLGATANYQGFNEGAGTCPPGHYGGLTR